jgi:hypothetical protein
MLAPSNEASLGDIAEDRRLGYQPEGRQHMAYVRRTDATDSSRREATPGDKCGGQMPGRPGGGRPAQGLSAEDRCQGYQKDVSPGDKCGGQVPGIPARGRPAQGISAEDRCQRYQPEEGQPRG